MTIIVSFVFVLSCVVISTLAIRCWWAIVIALDCEGRIVLAAFVFAIPFAVALTVRYYL